MENTTHWDYSQHVLTFIFEGLTHHLGAETTQHCQHATMYRP